MPHLFLQEVANPIFTLLIGKFVNNVLNVILNVYLRPLKLAQKEGKSVLEPVDLHIIFGDLEAFYNAHTQFYYRCVHSWQKGEFLGHAIYEYVRVNRQPPCANSIFLRRVYRWPASSSGL